MKRIFVALFLMFFVTTCFSQIRNIPAVVKATIQSHYPEAKDVNYTDYLTRYQVKFTNHETATIVVIANNGKIVSEETAMKLEQLPAEVKDGLSKSKYADWQVKSVGKYKEQGADEVYKINVAGESVISKRNLFFSKTGQLLKDKQAL